MTKKIVVIGPESTGKSTLCQQLAAATDCLWVPEFARDFLHTLGRPYTESDLLTIAAGQLNLEDEIFEQAKAKGHPYLFIDTDMYVMKVWSEFVFHRCDSYILNAIATRSYQGYLLCHTDLPWVADELREYPDLATREKLWHIYHDALVQQSTPWHLISGTESERFANALKAIRCF